jgi:alkaline phosphatase
MLKKQALIVTLAMIIIVIACSFDSEIISYNENARSLRKQRNIILFIGDGMGPAQVYAAMTVSNNHLFLEDFPYSGFSMTYSSDKYITDSAAGGTAIASGTKTKNGMIGVGPDSTVVQSIMEIAKKNGLSTGLISTTAITHATPASFVAHNAGRGNYEDIAKDFMNNTIDVFIGGGLNHFKNRKDGVDLTAKLAENGYDVAYTLDEMKNSGSNKLAALLAPVDMPKESEGRGTMLEDATGKAIEILSRNKNGFILMVEGSFIDFGGHAKDINYVTSELIDMDKAIGVAMNFAKSDGNTTVIVTADHETGGLTLTDGNISEHKVKAEFSTMGHTAVMVPVFSFGPGAENFSGIHDNTFFFGEFIDLLMLKK